jgi:hypothetical protein
VIRETAAKVVFFADGREQEYLKTADVEPFAAGNINHEVVWIDAEGNHWYKMVWAGDYHPRPQKEARFKWYVLAKVDAASNHLTIIWGQDTYPKDFKDVTPLGVSLEYRRQ